MSGRVLLRAQLRALLLALLLAPLLSLLSLSLSPSTAAAASAVSKAQAANDVDAVQILESERFRRLAVELRCLVCQNQSLADSDAPLAQDLRDEVVRLIASGRDDRAIKSFLVDRYGEFVLYRPALSARNAVLWVGPFLLLLIGAIAWWRLGRTADQATTVGAAAAVPAGPRPSGRQDPPAGGTAPAPGGEDGTGSENAHQALARIDRLLDDTRSDQAGGRDGRA